MPDYLQHKEMLVIPCISKHYQKSLKSVMLLWVLKVTHSVLENTVLTHFGRGREKKGCLFCVGTRPNNKRDLQGIQAAIQSHVSHDTRDIYDRKGSHIESWKAPGEKLQHNLTVFRN